MIWATVIAAAAACDALKLAGLSVPEAALRDPRVRRTAGLMPIVLLAALAAVQSFTVSSGAAARLSVDPRAVALAVAAVLAWRRAPFILVVVAAAATAALLRAA